MWYSASGLALVTEFEAPNFLLALNSIGKLNFPLL